MTDAVPGEARQASRPLRILARFLRRSWQALLVVLLAVVLGVAAYLSPGLVQADVHLDEGTVYVGKRDLNLMGTVNAQIDELSAATTTGDSRFRIFQHEENVQAFLPQSSNIHPYSPGRNILERATKMPPNAEVQQVGDHLLVYEQENGRAWFGSLEDMLQIDFLRDKPDLEVGEYGVVTLTTSGKAIGLNPNDATLVRLEGEAIVTTPVPISFDAEARNFEISAVGDNAVVLDRTNAQIWVEGMPKAFTISGQSQALLLPPVADVLGGEDGARALFANPAGLGAVTPDGFRSMSGYMDMTPVRPIQVGECIYGAFYAGAGEGSIVKRCEGEEPVITELGENLRSDGAQLEFQANRTTVALNDMSNGTVWLVDRGTVILPEDWENVRPQVVDEESDYTEGDPAVQPDRTKDNRDPVAKDDQLGARAGLSTILTVLDNDTDPDGDVLTIGVADGMQLNGATVQPVRGGAGLQITVDSDASGVIEVPYTVHDGRGGDDSATAFVTVYPQEADGGNQAPYLRGTRSIDGESVPGPRPLEVTLGDSDVAYRALLDWRDPEGDPLILVGATMDEQFDDIVDFRPDGEITYTDVGKDPGPKVIHVTVADRHGQETTGEMHVNVSEEVIPPTTFGDFATTMEGEPVMVEPLANDIRAINLTEVNAECGECVDASLADNRFTFTAEESGTYYVDYSVNNGATGLVRIDVLPRLTNRPPVAVGDEAHVPAMGSVTIDPLLNDTDPDGDVLVIQTVTDVPPSLNVTMERRTLLNIEATTELEGNESFHYWVSDGGEAVRGTVQVVSTAAADQIGPRTEDDVLRVRAGATGAVKVLENDTSPDGRDLTIAPELMDNPFGENAWVEGDAVRISVPAGAAPGVSQLSYRAIDSAGEATDGIIRVTVVSEEASNADPPQPRQVIDRVLAGTTTRIPIPLDGIDPQGDAVRLVGLGSIPSLGRVLNVGERYFEYEAFLTSAGTDTFQYKVVDSHGVEALGEVRIGVALPTKINNKPIAVMDEVRTRPGRQVQIAPLLNDYDLDGDPIMFASEEPARMQAEIPVTLTNDTELVMVAPQEAGDYDGSYDIIDERGEFNTGQLRVTVDEEAPLLAPITRDDLVDVAMLADKEFVEVDPLANDYDPDGPSEDLSVGIPGEDPDDELAPRLTDEGNVSIGVRDVMQQVRYVAVDGDGLETSGVITVPGRGDVVPVLRELKEPMKVRAGEELRIEINEVVDGTQGRDVELPSNDEIRGYPRGQATADGPSVVKFMPDLGYHGRAVVVFLVRDVVPASDTTTAREAYISIPVDVLKAETTSNSTDQGEAYLLNAAPELLTTNPVLEVGAAEEEQSVDVTRFFRDPEGDSVNLLEKPRVVRGEAGIVWEARGNRIHARALDSARKGESIVLSGTVVDGSVDANTAHFELTIMVVASKFQKVSAKDIVAEINAGDTLPVPVLGSVTSYLPHDKTVFLEGASVISGGGSAVANTDDGTVTITPAQGFHGTMMVSYTVNDALHDPDRRVNGRIQVRVRDVPGQPGHPYDITPGDGTVTFKYNSTGTGGDDAANVTATTIAVSNTGGTVPGTCGRGVCTISGLKNGHSYTATVREANSVGESQDSAASASFIPDAQLLPPEAVNAATGDRGLTVSWTHNRITSSPHGSSGVKEYRIRRYVGGVEQPDSPQVTNATTRTLWWGNLTNGQVSQFTVEAVSNHGVVANAAHFDSPPSVFSNPEYPAGPPMGSIGVTPTAIRDNVGGGFRVTFTTSAVDPNGDPIAQYRVVPITGGAERTGQQQIVTPGAGATHETTIYGMGTAPTTFRVYATNRHSEVALGISDPPIIAWALPKLTKVEAVAGDKSITVSAEHNMPSNSPGQVQYSLGGGWSNLPGNGMITGLVNGRNYTLKVRAVLEEMESPHETRTDLRPKGAAPNAPGNPRVEFLDLDTARATFTIDPNNWEATNGYDPQGYRFCLTRTSGRCRGETTSGAVDVPYGESMIRWSHGDHGGLIPVNPTAPREPRFDGGVLSFEFRHLTRGGECVVVPNGDDSAAERYTAGDDGVLTLSKQIYVQPPVEWVTPEPTDPEAPAPKPVPSTPAPVLADFVDVRCTLQGVTYSWSRLR
ncbi:Ig-like domain-containing protein [Tessaracoccus massiliensis]|uniref:Ig-like domain-containing protein n=1 Tax=Tessaracoccus massiliensis TaxID=1522311 RepID=UPI00058C6F3C|nr:Ig-like domain-containing protein [Tessaracoccus massiliensis]